ncbi:MAG: hypothetical protein ABIJ04_01810 [Bacteroidota bacterium]
MEKSKMLAFGAGILLLLALIVSGILFFRNKSLNNSVVEEKNKGTILLAQKHALQKEIENLTMEMTVFKGKNHDLDAKLAETLSKLNGAQVELNRIIRENKDIKAIEKKLTEVQALKDELALQVSALTEKLDNLTQENITLNNTILGLQNENLELAANVQMMLAVQANNFLMEALKGKADKPTVAAKRTRKLKAEFDIPVAIQDQVHFKIRKPGGIVIDSQGDKNFTVISLGPSTGLMASSSAEPGVPVKTKRFNLTYKPDTKLRPGIYTIEVYNNETYLGASQIKLR